MINNYTSADVVKAHDYIITMYSNFNIDSLNNMEASNIKIVRDNLEFFKREVTNIIKYFNDPTTKISDHFGQSIYFKCGLKYEYGFICKYDPHTTNIIIIKRDKHNILWDERPGKTHKENYGMMNENCHNCILCGNNFTNKSGICPILLFSLSNGFAISLEQRDDGDYNCWDIDFNIGIQYSGFGFYHWIDKLINLCDNALIIKLMSN